MESGGLKVLLHSAGMGCARLCCAVLGWIVLRCAVLCRDMMPAAGAGLGFGVVWFWVGWRFEVGLVFISFGWVLVRDHSGLYPLRRTRSTPCNERGEEISEVSLLSLAAGSPPTTSFFPPSLRPSFPLSLPFLPPSPPTRTIGKKKMMAGRFNTAGSGSCSSKTSPTSDG